LRLELLEHLARTGRRGDDLVFGRTASEPFTPSHVRAQALGAWAATAVGAFLRREAFAVELEPIGLHECRHTYADNVNLGDEVMLGPGRFVKVLEFVPVDEEGSPYVGLLKVEARA
jgi:hypothetical protein